MRASALVGRVVVFSLVASPAVVAVACGSAGMEEDLLGESSAAAGGDPAPLSQIAVPAPVAGDIVNTAAAIRLGKALFWDVQAGSDGQTACASCHFHAGVDNRRTNTLNPGPNGIFESGGVTAAG